MTRSTAGRGRLYDSILDTVGDTPAVRLARRAGHAGGSAPAVYNAANEACVDAFCAGEIGFLDICDIIAACLDEHLADGHLPDDDLTVDGVLAADAWARGRAAELAGARA